MSQPEATDKNMGLFKRAVSDDTVAFPFRAPLGHTMNILSRFGRWLGIGAILVVAMASLYWFDASQTERGKRAQELQQRPTTLPELRSSTPSIPIITTESRTQVPAISTYATLTPRPTPVKPSRATIPPGHSRERLHLKFQEGTAVRLRGNRFISLGNDDLSDLEAVLRKYPGVRIERLFSRPEDELARDKARIEAKSGEQQADLNLSYLLILPPGTDAEALLNDLNALSIVEIAYPEPLPQPPPGGFGAQ